MILTPDSMSITMTIILILILWAVEHYHYD